MSYFTVLLFSSYELFHITFIYVHTNFLIIIFLHQTNNTNICISDSHYNVSDHVSAHQPQNKNSLDKVYHEKKKKKNMGSIIDHISGTIYH